jgi:hypothetical protein
MKDIIRIQSKYSRSGQPKQATSDQSSVSSQIRLNSILVSDLEARIEAANEQSRRLQVPF